MMAANFKKGSTVYIAHPNEKWNGRFAKVAGYEDSYVKVEMVIDDNGTPKKVSRTFNPHWLKNKMFQVEILED